MTFLSVNPSQFPALDRVSVVHEQADNLEAVGIQIDPRFLRCE